MLKKNLILISLINDNIKELSLELAKKLNFFYLNTEDLIDYSLLDKEKMKNICGLKYLENKEKKIVESINSYEQTIVSMNHRTFIKNYSLIKKKNKIIYLQITKNDLEEKINTLKTKALNVSASSQIIASFANLNLDLIVFEERDKFFEKNCDFVVRYDISNIEETVNKILNTIKK